MKCVTQDTFRSIYTLHRTPYNMSRMNSWSRPSKHAATPPPLYLLPGGEATPYCHSCGRVIGSRKAQTSKGCKDTVKYCSERCRHQKPDERGRTIEKAFVSLLNGEDPALDSADEMAGAPSPQKKDKAATSIKKMKGESRIMVLCSTVEELVFGSRHDPEKVFGRKKNRAKRGVLETGEWKSVDMEDSIPRSHEQYSENQSDAEKYHDKINFQDEHDNMTGIGAGKVRLSQSVSDVNFSVGGERGWAETIEETEELKQKRLKGQRKAEEREAVRCAARRLCAFGVVESRDFEQGEKEPGAARTKQKKTASESLVRDRTEHVEKRKKCEAILREGTVAEASFAKGEWGIRWRE